MYPEYAPFFQVVTPLQSRLRGFFMRLKSNYAEGPSVSKEKLTGEEAPEPPSQKLDFEHPAFSAVLPGQKEIADLSCGDSWRVRNRLGLWLWVSVFTVLSCSIKSSWNCGVVSEVA